MFPVCSPDSKIKKRKLTPDGPKQEKVRRRKKTDDNSPTAVKKRKISKEAKEQEGVPTDISTPSNAQPHLLIEPMTFVRDLSLTNSESPIVRPKKIWKRKMKEGVNKAKPPKPAKEFSEGKTEEDDDDNSSAAGTYMFEICALFLSSVQSLLYAYFWHLRLK